MKHFFTLMLATIMIFGAVQLAFARTCETSAGTILDPYVDKNAAGTKVFGPMTAHYEIVAEPGEPASTNPCDYDDPKDGVSDDYYVKMTVSVRLTKGSETDKYSSPPYGPVCYLDASSQSAFVYTWLNTSVVPRMFTTFQLWAVKSYSAIADCGFSINGGLEPGCEIPFTSVDIELAVKE